MPGELELRRAAMKWLDGRTTPQVDWEWTRGFELDGVRVPLLDRQRGIRKPAGMEAALAIRTTYTAPDAVPPYEDTVGSNGLQRYKYRGTDPHHPENVAMRRAYELSLPLIWFVAVAQGVYEPIYPVWIVGDDPKRLEFTLAVDQSQRFLDLGQPFDADTRRWAERTTRQRLHQRVFRSEVLLAYEHRCAVCNLGHKELLDAAHIIADGAPNGQPIVPNGLTMCKIHHAAFDAKIMGVRPDLTLHIRDDVLAEIDGPMLRHGLQEMHNRRLMKVPGRKSARPDVVRLEERYEAFLVS